MADANRLKVDKGVLHHAVTSTWEEKSRAALAQWFSDNGFARGYGSNAANWSGLINPYTGQRSYSQAHYAAQRVDSRTPDATADERKKGFRFVPLVSDPMGQITWGAGNWPVNQSCINIEFLGDYRNISLRENDCKVVADYFRPIDRKLGGKLAIFGHQEVTTTGTACPANIMKSRNRIVDLINAADSGWPAPAPAPKPQPEQPKPITETTGESYPEGKKFEVIKATKLKNIPAGTDAADEVYQVGRIVENIVEKVSWSNGLTFYRTAYSKQNNLARGFLHDTLKEVVAQSPQPETKPPEETPVVQPDPIIPTPAEPEPTKPAEPSTPDLPGAPEPSKKPSWIVQLIAVIMGWFTRNKKK